MFRYLVVIAGLAVLAPLAAQARAIIAEVPEEASAAPQAAPAPAESAAPAADAAGVLAQGDPPLTQEMVNKTIAFFEWLLDVPMTQEQRNVLQSKMLDSWRTNDKASIETVQQALQIQTEVATHPPAERDLMREQTQPQVLEALRQAPNDETAKWLLTIYEAGHKPIADGAPPLTLQVTDAYAELLCFMASQVRGGEPFALDEEAKNAFAAVLAAQYGQYTPDEQKQFARMPSYWAATRVVWPTLGDDEKAKCREGWKQQLAALLPPPPAAPAEQPAADTGAQETGTEAPAAETGASDAYRKMQEHQETMSFISNMSTMQHQTNMAIISNMNSGWTYNYGGSSSWGY